MLKKVTWLVTVVLILSLAGGAHAAELWHYWISGGEVEAVNALIDAARDENPDFTFTDRGLPNSTALRQELASAFIVGDPPEMFQIAPGQDIKVFVDAGRLEPIDDVWTAVRAEEVFPEGIRNMLTFDGSAYAVPLNMHVINHIFYNKAIFDEFDLVPPTNWDEFNELAVFLQEQGIAPMSSNPGSHLVYRFLPSLVHVLGPDGYMEFGSGKIPMTDPRVREAFEFYRDNFAQYYLEGWSGYGWAEATGPLMEGRAAMYLNGDWAVALLEQRGWVPGEDFGSFPAPGMDKITIAQIDTIALGRGSEDIEGAKAFLTSAANVSGQAAFNAYKGSVAANLELEPTIYNPVLMNAYNAIQNSEYVLPNMFLLVPRILWTELDAQVTAFSLNPTDDVLTNSLQQLEAVRQEAMEDELFVEWPTFN